MNSSLDERFYGTWVNPLDGTEAVIFREDGTVSSGFQGVQKRGSWGHWLVSAGSGLP